MRPKVNQYRCVKTYSSRLHLATDVKPVGLKNPSIEMIKTLLNYQPMVAGISLTNDLSLKQYSSGVITDPTFECSSDYNDPPRGWTTM
jgi:hypothetical protein